ncbi:MAG: chemotaxis protein CheD [Polyangiaceae bacterium]|nr:chemotaxis protein CheD [Polyangiaceae bacterium]
MGAVQVIQSHQVVVRVGELRLAQSGEVIVTYGLGSGVALVLYDPTLRIGGVLHAMLSGPSNGPTEAPAKFVDAGADALLKELYAAGASRTRLLAAVAGGATPTGGFMQTGTKNLNVLKKVLWKHGITQKGADVGGKSVRALTLDCMTGRCESSTRDARTVLLP